MVIADTSVWVSHLRVGHRTLESLLRDGEVVCHQFIVGELACGNLKNRNEILSLLDALPTAPVVSHEELLHFVDYHKLMGKGIGFVDVHLLASCRLARIPLLTEDKKLEAMATKLRLSYR